MIGFIVFGLVVGVLARLIKPGRQHLGLLATLGLGLVGSLIGGTLAWLIGTGSIWELDFLGSVFAVIAAVLLVGTAEAITGGDKTKGLDLSLSPSAHGTGRSRRRTRCPRDLASPHRCRRDRPPGVPTPHPGHAAARPQRRCRRCRGRGASGRAPVTGVFATWRERLTDLPRSTRKSSPASRWFGCNASAALQNSVITSMSAQLMTVLPNRMPMASRLTRPGDTAARGWPTELLTITLAARRATRTLPALSRRGIHHALPRRPCQATRFATLATSRLLSTLLQDERLDVLGEVDHAQDEDREERQSPATARSAQGPRRRATCCGQHQQRDRGHRQHQDQREPTAQPDQQQSGTPRSSGPA